MLPETQPCCDSSASFVLSNLDWLHHIFVLYPLMKHNHRTDADTDIVNIGLHFFLKDVRPMLPPVMNRSIVDA